MDAACEGSKGREENVRDLNHFRESLHLHEIWTWRILLEKSQK